MRHIEVSQLWLQQRIASGDLKVQKVDGISNLADALTKHLQKGPLEGLMVSVNLETREGRRSLMPVCDGSGKLEANVAVLFESDERLCQVVLASGLVGSKDSKGFGPKRAHCRD